MNLPIDLIKKFKPVSNYICKNDTSSYFLVFFIYFFSTVIPSVYIERIFLSVFIDEYYNNIFNRKNSSQSTEKNIISVCPFIFINFRIVHA